MEPKKNPKYDLNGQRHLFLSVGMIISLSLVLVAFEWKSRDEGVVDFREGSLISCQFPEIPTPPPEPSPPLTVWKDDGSVTTNDSRYLSEDNVNVVPIQLSDNAGCILITESMPTFKDGDFGLREFVKNHLEYPKQAKRLGVEGRVFIEFIVEEDGSLSEFKVVKGVGGSLDEEAIRVMKLLPNFVPAEQQGIPVRVKMIYPIKFEL